MLQLEVGQMIRLRHHGVEEDGILLEVIGDRIFFKPVFGMESGAWTNDVVGIIRPRITKTLFD